MSNHSQKNNQIAKVFQDQFEVVGFRRTSIDPVANALHISKKTIYKLFGSKRAILEYIVHKKSIRINNKMNKQLKDISTDRKKIEWLVSQAFQLSNKRIKKSTAVKARYKNELSFSAYDKALFESFRDVINDAARRNVFVIKDVDLTVKIVQGIIVCANQILIAKPNINVEPEIKRTVLKLLLP
jgi:AcrR family transcriptional regulator